MAIREEDHNVQARDIRRYDMAEVKSIFSLKDDAIISQIAKDYMQAEKSLAKKTAEWDEYWNRYLGRREARSQPETGQMLSSIFIPKTGEKIDWLCAKYKQAIFNYRPIVVIKAKNTEDKVGGDLLNEMIDYQFFNIPNFRRKLNDMLKDAFIYGTGVIKVFWYDELYQPVIDVVPRKDFFIDPYARYVDEAKFAIHRFYRSKEQLWYSGLYKEKALKEYFENADTVMEEEGARADQLASENKAIEPSEEGRYEIWEYWTTEGLITVGLYAYKDKDGIHDDGKQILRRESKIFKHGKLPFRAYICNPKPHQFDGFGIVEQIKDIQDEYNTKRRQRLDNINLIIHKRGIVPKSAFNRYELAKMEENVPGDILKTNYPKADGVFQEMKMTDVTISSLQEIGMLNTDMENRTGIYQHAQGQQLGRRETATTTVSILQRADLLFGSMFEDFAESVLIPMADMFIELNKQFFKKEIKSSKVSVTGETALYKPGEIKGEYQYEINVSAIRGSNEMERAQLMQLGQIAAQNPILMQKIDWGVWLKTTAATFDMIKNPETLLQKEDENIMGGVGTPPSSRFGGVGGMTGLPPGLSGMTPKPNAPMIPSGMSEIPSKLGG